MTSGVGTGSMVGTGLMGTGVVWNSGYFFYFYFLQAFGVFTWSKSIPPSSPNQEIIF
ncbi:hypothetical protein CGRA01v4_09776 [Colletotrichum graminicola]|nr:hypothetical protein CGRA01v4_09776 [Colletotrichum graminicola]